MDSINARQEEENHQDLQGQAAIDRIRQVIDKTQTCFFCTSADGVVAARPMNVRQLDVVGRLWFLSASDSHKNRQLEHDPAVTLYLQGSRHSDFLQLSGSATVSRDREKIDELWEPLLRTWFTQGKDDPRITVIQLMPTHGYYWDNKHGNAVAGIKMLLGAALGKTMDDSIEGRLTL